MPVAKPFLALLEPPPARTARAHLHGRDPRVSDLESDPTVRTSNGRKGCPVNDAPHSNLSLLLYRHEAARRLAISVSQLDRLVRSGEIEVVRFGRNVRFRPGSLVRFAEANTHDAADTTIAAASRPHPHTIRRRGRINHAFKNSLD